MKDGSRRTADERTYRDNIEVLNHCHVFITLSSERDRTAGFRLRVVEAAVFSVVPRDEVTVIEDWYSADNSVNSAYSAVRQIACPAELPTVD